jgi:hypothetical protein
MRATIGTEGFMVTVMVDGAIVGQDVGARGRVGCVALMDELNESDEKCDLVKSFFVGRD